MLRTIRIAGLPIALLVLFVFSFPGTFVEIRYVYLFLGTYMVLPPLLYAVFAQKKFVGGFILTTLYCFIANFIYELLALKLHYWEFPGTYIGTLTVENLVFPVEEFVFYVILAAPSLVSYYELFFLKTGDSRDGKKQLNDTSKSAIIV